MEEKFKLNLKDIHKIASDILADRKNSNKIVDLFDLISSSESSLYNSHFQAIVKCLTKIFNYYIDSRELVCFKDDNNNDIDRIKKINTYKSWLINLYDKLIELFIEIIENKNLKENSRKLALQSLLKFVEEEGKFPFRQVKNEDESNFPVYLLEKILKALLSDKILNHDLIVEYIKYYQYDDFTYNTIRVLFQILNDDKRKYKDSEIFLNNLFDLINPIRLVAPLNLLPKSLQSETNRKFHSKDKNRIRIRLCELQKYSNMNDIRHEPIDLPIRKFKFNYERDAEIYSSLMLKFLSYPLPPSIFKKALIYLDNHALKHFVNPLMLSDFLINSFQMGGIISLLSLSPLYILMSKCNLEYPNFYGQLYQLLEPAITYEKHRSRFLFWCDLFLTSTHIPSTIVASFIKKLTRLCLCSTPDVTLVLLPFIQNLFIRHPIVKNMLEFKEFKPENDPFDENEKEPEKTNAIKSCLWELNLLRMHYIPEISSLSEKIQTELPRYEQNLEDILDMTIDDVIQKIKSSLEKKNKKFSYDLNCGLYNEL